MNGVIPTLYRMLGSEQQPLGIAACYREKEEALKEVILGYKPMDPKPFEGLVINSEKSCALEFLEGAQAFTYNLGIPHFVRTELHFGYFADRIIVLIVTCVILYFKIGDV